MKVKSIVAIFTLIMATGCTATWVTKSVEVTKDENGKIVQTVEKETAEQRQTAFPFTFEHLRIKD